MAPVLAIPVLNRPDLLAKCLASIDTDVDLIVIDNSPAGFAAELIVEHYLGEFFVTEPPANLGYGPSLNHVIQTRPAEPFWLFANADVEFGAGDLDRLIAEMEKGGGFVGVTDWRVFGLSAATVDTVGFFDPNFYPAYAEDADYERRCDLAGVSRYFIDGTTSHVGSVCYRSDERNARHNARTYPANVAYYIEKWGGAPRGGETYTTPFNRGGDLGDWRLDRRRLAANQWT